MSEALDGVGVTKERKAKSHIVSKPRTLTNGGIVIEYGQYDTEHCALDVMYNKGFIEDYQRDAGYSLRNLYYSFNVTGRWIDEGSKGYDGDIETERDRKEMAYHAALRAVDLKNRGIVRCVCIEETYVPADYNLIMDIKHGLEDLYRFFEKKT